MRVQPWTLLSSFENDWRRHLFLPDSNLESFFAGNVISLQDRYEQAVGHPRK
jgi:hypothetical protein